MSANSALDHIVILNCYGRGGSGIVWRMIGSSPDVVMTTEEWHVAVFGRHRLARKFAANAFRLLGIESLEPLRRYALRRTLLAQSPEDLAAQPDARFAVVKVMDHHIVFSDMIRRSFPKATEINLTRHPFGQCESLMRSGLDLAAACKWYSSVADLMATAASRGAISVRFEDVVSLPMQTCGALYDAIGVRWAEDMKFILKIKPYGDDRTSDVDVRNGHLIRIGVEDANSFVDASVLHGERTRLSEDQRRIVWQLTGATAASLGYTVAGSSL